jgi:hypothetical protein
MYLEVPVLLVLLDAVANDGNSVLLLLESTTIGYRYRS